MKKIFLSLLLFVIILSGCAKKEPGKTFKPEDVSSYFRALDKAKDLNEMSKERASATNGVMQE